jgi:lipopolysaccharide transport system permease protein
VFLFEKLLLQLTHFAVALLINLIIVLGFRVVPSWGIFLFPLVALPIVFLGTAVGLFASMLSIVAEKFAKMMKTCIGLTFWITPIIYSGKLAQSWAQTLVDWNPLTYLVCSARDIILFSRLYDSNGYWACTALSVILLLLSWRAFYICEVKIIERMV